MAPNLVGKSDPEAPDHVLVHRVVDGDEGALAILYDRYAGIVYSVVKRVLGDAAAADEILQDVFLQLWRTAQNYDQARGTLPAWLLVMARHRAIDRLRRHHRGTSEIFGDFLAGELAVDLEREVVRNELMARVRAALEDLPPEQRLAFELAYFEGLTHSEIAARLSEPLGTVKTRLRTALIALKRALNP